MRTVTMKHGRCVECGDVVVDMGHECQPSDAKVSGGVSGGYCEWKYWQPCEMNTWDTSCGEAHCMIEGGIQENKYKFCPYCGKPIKEL
jgi:hypothetical protein